MQIICNFNCIGAWDIAYNVNNSFTSVFKLPLTTYVTMFLFQVLAEKMGLPDGLGFSSNSSDLLGTLFLPLVPTYDNHCCQLHLHRQNSDMFILLPSNSACCQWWTSNEKRLATLEFDRTRKSMGAIVKSKSGDNSLLVKVLLYIFPPAGNNILYSYFCNY